jgi:DNA-binding NtrC family response regulator
MAARLTASSAPVRVAVVEDDPGVRALIARVLRAAGFQAETFSSGDSFLGSRSAAPFDVVVSDLVMEGSSGLEVLRSCRAQPDPPEVLLVTGHATIPDAVEAMRRGAFDYFAKPIDIRKLRSKVEQALRLRRGRTSDLPAISQAGGTATASFVAESPAMKEVLALAGRAAGRDCPVLIVGEPGTGKEHLANFLHAASPRAGRSFRMLDCESLSADLLSRQLFGFAPVLYPDSPEGQGLYEDSDGGTLLINGVEALSASDQARLARAIASGSVLRLGERAPTPADVRILAATGSDLPGAVVAGRFRSDLFYRISVVTLAMPPLRRRREDIPELARIFLEAAARRLGRRLAFGAGAVHALLQRAFPGNVRQLRHSIERASVLSEDGVLRARDLLGTEDRSFPRRRVGRPIHEEISPERLERMLREVGDNRSRAARELGISRASLYRLLAARRRSGRDDAPPAREGS